jgi:hypothetical protein
MRAYVEHALDERAQQVSLPIVKSHSTTWFTPTYQRSGASTEAKLHLQEGIVKTELINTQ